MKNKMIVFFSFLIIPFFNKNKKIRIILYLLLLSLPLSLFANATTIEAPILLKCEYMEAPLGVDIAKPRLSWQFPSQLEKGFHQTAYQIVVEGAWDSGKVLSDESIHIEYSGVQLKPATRYRWRVRIWNEKGEVSTWSEDTYFVTGIFDAKDWKACWIARYPENEWMERHEQSRKALGNPESPSWTDGSHDPRDPIKWALYHPKPNDPAPLLRKRFEIKKTVKEAVLFVTGMGHYQLYFDGERMDGGALVPGITDYSKRVLYNTYDMKEWLKKGVHTLGLVLGRGWYNELCLSMDIWGFSNAPWVGQPKALIQMMITYQDGSKDILLSNADWKVTDGPVIFDDFRAGDVYDATKEIKGWSDVAYDDSKWETVSTVPAPQGRMCSEMMEPIEPGERFFATSVTALVGEGKQNVWLFTFPQNIPCQMDMTFDGTGMRGKILKFTFYSYRDKTGKLLTPSGPTYSYYICRGDTLETINLPQFSYAGARYVTVEGLNKKPGICNMVLKELRSGVKGEGSFETSDQLLNKLHWNTRWTQSGNLHSYPQDCWTREKLGWTGDAHVSVEVAMFNFGMEPFFTKWMNDHLDNQSPEGGLSAYIPNLQYGNEGLTWSGTGIIIPWYQYLYYGDKRILEQMYLSGCKYLSAAVMMDSIPYIYFGGPADWCVPWAKSKDQLEEGLKNIAAVPISSFPGGGKGHYIYGTAYYYYLSGLLEKIAEILGMKNEVDNWKEIRANVLKAFTDKFFDTNKKIFHGERHSDYRQAANAIPLLFEMVPEEYYNDIVENLIGDIVGRHRRHLNTGVIGTRALFEMLPLLGRNDLAYQIGMVQDYPGYLWPILDLGLTTLPEHWEGFGTHDHIMLGSGLAFFYKYVGGIQPDPVAPGFKHFYIRPWVDNPLSWVKSSYNSVRGIIRSDWRKDGSKLILEADVPPNTEAEIEIPDFQYNNPTILEQGKVVWEDCKFKKHKGITEAIKKTNAVSFKVNSGSYRFEVLSSEPVAIAREAGIDIHVPDIVCFPGEKTTVRLEAKGRPYFSQLRIVSGNGMKNITFEPAGNGIWDLEFEIDADSPVWREGYIDIILEGVNKGENFEVLKRVPVAISAIVEVRFENPKINVTPGYNRSQRIFYMKNYRKTPVKLKFDATVILGWDTYITVDGKRLGKNEEILINPGIFTKVEAAIIVPPNADPDKDTHLNVRIIEENKVIGQYSSPVVMIKEKILESFKDDFRFWHAEEALNVQMKEKGIRIETRKGAVAALVSDWITMDFSNPMSFSIDVSELKGLWCFQLEDEFNNIHYLIGDTNTAGLFTRGFDNLNFTGPQRFRLRFLSISRGEICETGLNEIFISQK